MGVGVNPPSIDDLNNFIHSKARFRRRFELNHFVFHWTNRDALKRIQREGLHPRIGGSTGEELPELFKKCLNSWGVDTGSYLTNEIETWQKKYPHVWEDMIEERTGIYTTLDPLFWSGEEEDQVLLLIDRSGLEGVEDTYYPMTEIFYTPIPPERIWLLTYHQQRVRTIQSLSNVIFPPEDDR